MTERSYVEYNRDGITIIVMAGKTIFKKNGLVIEIPDYILQDFSKQWEKESMELRDQYDTA